MVSFEEKNECISTSIRESCIQLHAEWAPCYLEVLQWEEKCGYKAQERHFVYIYTWTGKDGENQKEECFP